jgi:hypothetical protein
MIARPAVDEIRLSRVLFLLALSVFINYLDRGNLSLAAPLFKNEFQLSASAAISTVRSSGRIVCA